MLISPSSSSDPLPPRFPGINSSSATLHPHQQLAPIRPHVPHDKQTQNGSASTPTTSTTAACNSTNMGPYASLKGYVLHIQENRCYKPVYARAKRCMTCITKIAGRVCLFRDLRVFVLPDTPNASIKETTPTFFATFSKGATFEWLYSHNSNRDITNEEKDRLIETASQALLPSLQNAMRLAALPHAVCRPSSRIARRTCQHCSDFFSISYWFCTDCGREFCAECQEKIKHHLPAQDGGKPATSPQAALELARELPDKWRMASNLGFDRLSPSISVVGGKIQDKSLHQLLSCSLGRLHGAESLIPVTTLTPAALSTLFKEATEKQVSRKPSLLKSIQIPDRIVSCGIDQPHTWNSDFPLHISGVNKKSRLNWTPWSFSKAFGKMDCEIQEGLTGDIRKTKISSFFDNFGVEKRESGVWSLKVSPAIAVKEGTN